MAGRRHPRNGNWKRKRNAKFKAQKGICHWCNRMMNKGGHGKVKELSATLDHVVPMAEGGNGHWDNLVAACYRCNQARNNLWLRNNRKPTPDKDKGEG